MAELNYDQTALLSILLIISLAFAVQPVSAQSTGCIPVFGQKWAKSYIGVYVAGGVSEVQKQQVAFALNVWYSAQQWFIDSFEGGSGTPYMFYLTDSADNAAITVSFLIGEGLTFAGRALNFAYAVPGNTYVKGEIQINLPPDKASNPNDLEVESIILHEFGHALGLGHSTIQSDAMYAIDNYPQSYGIPSTLDLYAVYMIKQTSDPSSLGGSVCLPSQIGYGIPPWVQQNPNNTVISYPGGTYPWGFNYSFNGSAIVVGQSGTLQMSLYDTGNYPLRLVSLNAQTDSSQTLAPGELLPQELEPGSQQEFNFQLQGPDTSSAGTHSVTFELGFQVLTPEGWSSDTDYRSVSASYEVVSQPTGFEFTVSQYSPETNSGLPDFTTPLVVMAVILLVVVIVIFALRSGKEKRKPKPRMQTATRNYCANCGAKNPESFVFCGKCGEKLIKP